MKKTISILALAMTGNYLVAAQAKDSLPGNTSLPSGKEELQKLAASETGTFKYKVEDYFAKPKQSGFQLSPDGKYFSYREKAANGKRHIYVKNTATGEVKRILEEKEELIRDYGWINNNRLFYMKDKGGDENYQLFAVDLDGQNDMALTPFNKVRTSILRILKDQPDYLIIDMNKDNPEVFEPYRINVKTGALTKLFENKDTGSPISGYDFDKDGNLKGYTQQKNGTNYTLYYRSNDKEPFKEIITTTWKDNFGILDFDYTTPNPDDAYVLSNMTNNTAEILLYDFAQNKPIRRVFSNETYDVGGMGFSRKRGYEPDYYSYTGEKYQIVPVSNTFKKLYERIRKQFDKYSCMILSATDNEDKYVVYVTSDRLFGQYHLYDVTNDKFQMLVDLMPTLKEADMARVKPITFQSRDGLTLHGYLTLPASGASGQKIPLIVNPHGGPYGPRDEWGFDPEAQLFASRGYATLQVNYRGSGGYGKKFSLAGSKQIGRNMLNDLEDGVAYVQKNENISDKRLAIYGGSYGGLATLGSLVKTPDLYTCGVDYVGVANLFTFYQSFPPYWKPYLSQVYEQWYNPENEEEKKIMTAVSPALNIDKIRKPLFVVQGANDPRVNINESDQIVSQLRAKGFDVPYMVKYNEGHGFSHEENRIELYKCMMGFFAKHLK